MLWLALLSIPIWLITGFNIVEGAVPFISIQWSTFGTFAFFFYLFMVNFQVGGLDSLHRLSQELVFDLRFSYLTLRNPGKARIEYPQATSIDSLRASIICFLRLHRLSLHLRIDLGPAVRLLPVRKRDLAGLCRLSAWPFVGLLAKHAVQRDSPGPGGFDTGSSDAAGYRDS